MKFFYLLWHIHYDQALLGGEDVKLIGIYTSIEKGGGSIFSLSSAYLPTLCIASTTLNEQSTMQKES